MADTKPWLDPEALQGDDNFLADYGEDMSRTLNLDTWLPENAVEQMMALLKREISDAVNAEDALRSRIRHEVLPLIRGHPGGPQEAGVYSAEPAQFESIYQSLLFAGRVEAVNGSFASYESLPMGITQIGIAIVGYEGTQGTFSQRLFRKEMAEKHNHLLDEVFDCISRRQENSSSTRKAPYSRLARRGIRAYAERAALVDKARAEWRIGQGNPCAYDLLTGSGYQRLLDASLDVLHRLVKRQKKFVFVNPILEDRGWLTLGSALNPGEYTVIETMERFGKQVVGRWQYDAGSRQRVARFVEECCPDILTGVFRTSTRAPPRLFHAHREHVHVAARIAMADSLLRRERGYPLLLDMAEMTCRSVFGEDGFLGLVQDAYSQVGAGLQFFNDSRSRR
ncbi:hypothetical protein [Myxococcus landrumensis]|uniref:Uncharacterized protein n=1 Tax=Myxococcus landrumensis TaxID=2813577 RepID=A0ABX7NBF5_9BACT|nr:hypothetical protein [Myxococcus landrumus]QSQ14824.1 hypothetical protein JY572_01660 [Myxococcus landrumus]